VVLPYAIVLFSLYTLWRDYHAANWGNAAFAAFNAVATLYAIAAYIGLRNSLVDVVMNIVQRLYVPVKPRRNRKAKKAKANSDQQPQLDWESTLYLGVAAQREGREARRIRRTVVLPENSTDTVDLATASASATDVLVATDVVPAQSATDMPPAAAALLDFVRSVNGGKVGGVELRVDGPTRLTVTVDLTD
jgi:hypothetical protein